MWEISNNRQLVSFLISLVFGVAYAMAYTVLKAVRRVVKHSAVGLFFEDIIFFEIISFITFLLLLSLVGGEIRFYILLAIFIGFVAFYFTLSKFFCRILAFVFGFLLRAFARVRAFIGAAFGVFCKLAGKITAYCGKKSRICYKYLKNILKAMVSLVYTKSNNTVNKKV